MLPTVIWLDVRPVVSPEPDGGEAVLVDVDLVVEVVLLEEPELPQAAAKMASASSGTTAPARLLAVGAATLAPLWCR